MTWLLDKLGEVNGKIQTANLLAGVTPVSSLSNAEINERWNEFEEKTRDRRDQYAQADTLNSGSNTLHAQMLLDDEYQVFLELSDELNKRAREAGYASATAYGQAFQAMLAKQKLNAPLTPEEEQLSLRASGSVSGASPTLATGGTLNKAAQSAQEKTLLLVTQTAGYQRMVLENRIADLEALKASNEEEMKKVSHSEDLLELYRQNNAMIDERMRKFVALCV